jgi:MFS family permease
MLVALLTAMFMAQFDFFAVNVAAPTIEAELHAGQGALQLIVGGYAFAYAAGMISGGRLGDLLGHRRLFVAGMACFTAASVLCGIAQTSIELIAARLAQGLAAAAMIPQVLAVITTSVPEETRPRALGWSGAVAGLGAIAGQILGGVLIEANPAGLSWRSVFLVNLPVGLLAVPLAQRTLPSRRPQRRPALDLFGALGLAVAIALVLVPLALGRTAGWPGWTWVCFAAAPLAGVLTLRWQRILSARGGTPVLELSLFRDRAFLAGLGASAAFLAYFASLMFTLALLLQAGLGLNPVEAGLVFAPMGVTFMIASLKANQLLDRFGPSALVAAVLVTGLGIGAIVAILANRPVTPAWLVPALALSSAGNGIVWPSLIRLTLAEADARHAGAAAGTLTTSQQFAGALGVAGVGGIFFAVLGPTPGRSAYEHAMQTATTTNLGLVGLVMLGVVILSHVHRRGTPEPPRAASARTLSRRCQMRRSK